MQLLLSMPVGLEWILVLVALASILTLMGFWVYTIVDVAKSNFIDEVTKIVWLLVVLLLGLLGAIIYWGAGRPGKINISQNQYQQIRRICKSPEQTNCSGLLRKHHLMNYGFFAPPIAGLLTAGFATSFIPNLFFTSCKILSPAGFTNKLSSLKI